MTTLDMRIGSNGKINQADNAWVVEVLESDDLRLANSRRLEPYGRAKLGRWVTILLWAMRIYVLLSILLIVAQIYISLKA